MVDSLTNSQAAHDVAPEALLEVRVEDARPERARGLGLALLDQRFEKDEGTASPPGGREVARHWHQRRAAIHVNGLHARALPIHPRRVYLPQRHEADERFPVRTEFVRRAPRNDGAERAENESPALTRRKGNFRRKLSRRRAALHGDDGLAGCERLRLLAKGLRIAAAPRRIVDRIGRVGYEPVAAALAEGQASNHGLAASVPRIVDEPGADRRDRPL